MTNDDIKFQHPIYKAQQKRVTLCNAMYDGYDTAKKYLLQSTNENEQDYAIRVDLATYNNVLERIIVAQVGMVYRKELIYEDVPEKYLEWFTDIKFEQHLQDATTRADVDGKGLIMLDMPIAGGEPYLVQIKRESLINWRMVDGKFTMAVIAEQYAEEDGFKIEYKTQYRHLKENGDIDIWREVEGSGMTIVESITTSYDFLPLYLADLGDLPPMYNIAVMTKNLFNCSAMTANAIRKATDPSLLTVGLGLDDNNELKLGVNSTINTDNENARVEWIELDGASIPIAKQDLKDQETTIGERALNMQAQGADSSKTATQVNKENSESNARLSDISSVMEYMANNIYQGLMRMKYNQDAIGKICYARDFKDEGVANNLMPSINQAWVSGLISHETALTTLVEKEQLVIDDIEAEIKLAGVEADERLPEAGEPTNQESSNSNTRG